MKNKIIWSVVFLFYFGLFNYVFGATNYTYSDESIKYNTREAYDFYAGKVNAAVYKAMPRTFSYINREPQFAVKINKTGHVDKA